MEENLSIDSLQIYFQSDALPHLTAELYDFSDKLLRTCHLANREKAAICQLAPLRNFYFRILNEQKNICEMYSYFWSKMVSKDEPTWLSEIYNNFIFKIQIKLRKIQEHDPLTSPLLTKPEEEVSAKDCLLAIKERVFKALEKEQFFKVENVYRCNFVRKNKTHKNLTTLLVKNSSNILKTIHDNINKSSILKSFNQIQITDPNETTEDTLDLIPLRRLKKVSSEQEPPKTQSENQFQLSKGEQDKQARVIIEAPKQLCFRARMIKKSPSQNKFKRKVYIRELEKETILDLKNQRETLDILQNYVQNHPKESRLKEIPRCNKRILLQRQGFNCK